MLAVEEALEIVRTATGAPRARPEVVALSDALGRVLAEDVAMDHDVPPFHRATMDGFALRAGDAARPGAVLDVVGRVVAGVGSARALGAGEAVAIMTGAAVPPGADAVVPVEHTEPAQGARGAETRVRIVPVVQAGQNLARRAEQVARGAIVAACGARIHPGTLGVLAAAGRASVRVAARPRVAIVGTGDELVPVDSVPGPAQIRDSNGHALAAQARRAGALAEHFGPVPDEEARLRTAVLRGLGADLLCLSGGVSMGDRDLVPSVLAACGVERRFHRWAVKPGGPLWFGVRGDTLVFGLPGNPAATFVGFELLAVPAIRARLGLPFAARASARARIDGVLPAPISRRQYVPVALSLSGSSLVARPVRALGSGDLFALGAADGFAVVRESGAPATPTCAHGPADARDARTPAAPDGDLVEVMPLDGSLPS